MGAPAGSQRVSSTLGASRPVSRKRHTHKILNLCFFGACTPGCRRAAPRLSAFFPPRQRALKRPLRTLRHAHCVSAAIRPTFVFCGGATIGGATICGATICGATICGLSDAGRQGEHSAPPRAAYHHHRLRAAARHGGQRAEHLGAFTVGRYNVLHGRTGGGPKQSTWKQSASSSFVVYSKLCIIRTPRGPSRLDVLSWSSTNQQGQAARS